MKLFTAFLFMIFATFSFSAFADGDMGTVLTILSPFLVEMIEKYPVLGKIVSIMVSFRLVMKPLMSALLTIFKDTQFKFLSFSEEVLDNKIYKSVVFVLDYLLSVKLPKKKE